MGCSKIIMVPGTTLSKCFYFELFNSAVYKQTYKLVGRLIRLVLQDVIFFNFFSMQIYQNTDYRFMILRTSFFSTCNLKIWQIDSTQQ